MDGLKAFFYEPAAWLSVSGGDAPGFLQSQFSNDLGACERGRCVYGLWLDRKGKVQADGWVLCGDAGNFFIHSYFSSGAAIREKLESHIIADDVEVGAADGAGAVSLFGEGAAALIEASGVPLPLPGVFSEGSEVKVFCGRRSAGPAYEVVFGDRSAASGWKAGLEAAGALFVSEEELHFERIRSGIPAVPVDIGPSDLPAEGGLEADAISFTKGCFIGQEVVARMHHRGRPRRSLFHISGTGMLPELPASVVTDTGDLAGELRSAVPEGGGWRGIALLKREEIAPGAGFRIGKDGVEVCGETAAGRMEDPA